MLPPSSTRPLTTFWKTPDHHRRRGDRELVAGLVLVVDGAGQVAVAQVDPGGGVAADELGGLGAGRRARRA